MFTNNTLCTLDYTDLTGKNQTMKTTLGKVHGIIDTLVTSNIFAIRATPFVPDPIDIVVTLVPIDESKDQDGEFNVYVMVGMSKIRKPIPLKVVEKKS